MSHNCLYVNVMCVDVLNAHWKGRNQMHTDTVVACGHQWDWGLWAELDLLKCLSTLQGKRRPVKVKQRRTKGRGWCRLKSVVWIRGELCWCWGHFSDIIRWYGYRDYSLGCVCVSCCECVCISSPIYVLISKLCVCVFCLRVHKCVYACTCLQSVCVLCTLSCKFQSGVP